MVSLVDAIQQTHRFRLSVQLAHWNITGPNFIALHELLGDHYAEIGDGLDMLAERHRHLGNEVPADVLSSDTPALSGDWQSMVQALVAGHESLLETLHALEASSAEAGDPGTADLATERIRAHHEQAWMLRSHLG